MKFDTKAELTSSESIPNGMGGHSTVDSVVADITIFTTPVKAEILLREYGIVSTTSLKVFTKDEVPNEFLRLKFDGHIYKQLQLADFGKIRMMLVEVV